MIFVKAIAMFSGRGWPLIDSQRFGKKAQQRRPAFQIEQ